MPNWYRGFPNLVYWSMEQFNYPLPSRRSKGWDQGKFPCILISSGRISDAVKACINMHKCYSATSCYFFLLWIIHKVLQKSGSVQSCPPLPWKCSKLYFVPRWRNWKTRCMCVLLVPSKVSILSHPSVLQVHGQKAAWEDPVEWVRDTLPWPSAQQDQSKLYHLPPPSVGPHSIVSPPEERSGKDSTPNSLESDPLVCFQLANEISCYWFFAQEN